MKCAHRSHENRERAAYCDACGKPLLSTLRNGSTPRRGFRSFPADGGSVRCSREFFVRWGSAARSDFHIVSFKLRIDGDEGASLDLGLGYE